MNATVERAMAVEVDQRVHIAAPPERVWRALVEPADLRRWLFPSAVADVRPGGSWRFTFPHWPSARGLHHPALNFGGPIVELEPGRVLAVEFEPPYWGVLRFELAPEGDGTELRMTQRGFAGNEEWLADFRGGWGSFSDRLALLCETGEVAIARRLEATRAAARTLEPGELRRSAGAARRPRVCRHGRTGTPTAARSRSCVPGGAAGDGYELRREEACDALCLALPPTADLQAARASLERSLPRRGWTAAGPLRAADRPGPPRGGLRAGAPLPARTRQRRPRAVRARLRARLLRARPRRRAARTSLRAGALALAGGPHPRPLDTPLGRLPDGGRRALLAPAPDAGRRAHRRLGGQRLDGRAQPRARARWTFADDGRIERLVLRFDPAVPRMVAA